MLKALEPVLSVLSKPLPRGIGKHNYVYISAQTILRYVITSGTTEDMRRILSNRTPLSDVVNAFKDELFNLANSDMELESDIGVVIYDSKLDSYPMDKGKNNRNKILAVINTIMNILRKSDSGVVLGGLPTGKVLVCTSFAVDLLDNKSIILIRPNTGEFLSYSSFHKMLRLDIEMEFDGITLYLMGDHNHITPNVKTRREFLKGSTDRLMLNPIYKKNQMNRIRRKT